MCADKTKDTTISKQQLPEGVLELLKIWRGEKEEDVVETFSREIEADLRRILGDRYKGSPKRSA